MIALALSLSLAQFEMMDSPRNVQPAPVAARRPTVPPPAIEKPHQKKFVQAGLIIMGGGLAAATTGFVTGVTCTGASCGGPEFLIITAIPVILTGAIMAIVGALR